MPKNDNLPVVEPNQPQPEQPAKVETKKAAKEPKLEQAVPVKDAGIDMFLLEKLFPDARDVFRSSSLPDPNTDCLVALDTNALLLPYSVGKDDLKSLGDVYSKIAGESRLFLPERVAREFIKHRDRKLAEMVQAIGDVKSRINIGQARISPLLEGLDAHDSLAKASEDLAAARKAYVAALEGLSSQIRSWRGNDPVTSLYASLFGTDQLIGPVGSQAALEAELAYRFRNKVPPGYKDGGKPDGGIGDFAIWKALLNLGQTKKKDLIFVTGEEKADWFIRMGGESVYPRPELVDEYRRASGGCTIRLSSLHDLLREMAAPDDLVAEVKAAEISANTAVLQASASSPVGAFASSSHTSLPVQKLTFDYSTNDGKITINFLGKSFDLSFSKASDVNIHLYRSGTTKRIARVKEMVVNLPTFIDAQETSSRVYTVQLGEGFLVENNTGDVLAGRIIAIQDDSRGADRDEVTFCYSVFERGERILVP